MQKIIEIFSLSILATTLLCIAWLSSGNVPAARRSFGLPISTEGPIYKIYYGADLARANALWRMCAEAHSPCELVKDVLPVLSCREGDGAHHVQGTGQGDTFAPPVLEMPNSARLSQSAAEVWYLAEKLGFGVGLADPLRVAKSFQYLTDLNDLQTELLGRVMPGMAVGQWQRMRAFNDGGRLAAWLGNIERSIEGPFYFGQRMSACDFFLVRLITLSH